MSNHELQTRFISDEVAPCPPHGRLHVQRLLDENGAATLRVIVTGIDATGGVIEEREGRVELGAMDDPASLDAEHAPVAMLEATLKRDVRLALEGRAALN